MEGNLSNSNNFNPQVLLSRMQEKNVNQQVLLSERQKNVGSRVVQPKTEKNIKESKEYYNLILGVLYIFFVIIVINGIIKKKKEIILQKMQKISYDTSKSDLLKILLEELCIVPVILLGYFILLLVLVYVSEFIIFILLRTDRIPCRGQEQQQKNIDINFLSYLKKNLFIFFLSFILLFVLNIFLLIFIFISMITFLKTKNKGDSNGNINNSFINNILRFYKNCIIILSFISFYYFAL